MSAASWAWLISLHIRSMWETICDAQAHSCTHSSNSKFLSKFSRKHLSGMSDQKAPPPPPFQKTSDLRWPKFTPKYPPPHFGKLQIWDDQSLLRNTLRPPIFGKLQIWDDQSLLWNIPPPPFLENFRFEMTKVYSKISHPPPPFWKTSDLRWPKFTPKYPPPLILENFRFEMTKVYSEIPIPFRKIREIICRD